MGTKGTECLPGTKGDARGGGTSCPHTREEARKSHSPQRKSQKLPGLGRKKKTVTWAPAPGESVHRERLVHRVLGMTW